MLPIEYVRVSKQTRDLCVYENANQQSLHNFVTTKIA